MIWRRPPHLALKISAGMSFRSAAMAGRNFHLGQDVPLQVHARRDLGEGQDAVTEFEHGALGDVEHRLARLGGVGAAGRSPAPPSSRISCPCLPGVMASLPSATRTFRPPAVKEPQ